MQATFRGKSANQILHQAEIVEMLAGNVEIVYDDFQLVLAQPEFGSAFCAMTNGDGDRVDLSCGPRAMEKLRALWSKVDQMQCDVLRREDAKNGTSWAEGL